MIAITAEQILGANLGTSRLFGNNFLIKIVPLGRNTARSGSAARTGTNLLTGRRAGRLFSRFPIGICMRMGLYGINRIGRSGLRRRRCGFNRRRCCLDRSGRRFDRLSCRLDGLGRRLDGLSRRLDRLSRCLNRLSRRLDGLSRRYGRLSRRLDGLSRRLNRLSRRLDGLSRRYDFGNCCRCFRGSGRRFCLRRILTFATANRNEHCQSQKQKKNLTCLHLYVPFLIIIFLDYKRKWDDDCHLFSQSSPEKIYLS